jgi:hypothetical protein
VAADVVHVPAPEQTGTWHSPAVQFWQLSPLSPHALVEVPPAQLDPVQHPVQQPPPKHFPPVQVLPLESFADTQPPDGQVACLHSPGSPHGAQAAPLSPQALVEVPPPQLEPVQQPVQQEPP